MTISERIFELIRERGYTQKEFSKKTGIAESTISDWKKKGTNPVSDKILTICDVLEVSPYFLLSGVEREDRKSAGKAEVKKAEPAKSAAVKSAPEKEKVKKAEPEKIEVKKGNDKLPNIATVAKDEDDYHIGSSDDDKAGKKDKKKDKKDKKEKIKDKETGGKDKKKKKDKDKKKKKKGYLITY